MPQILFTLVAMLSGASIGAAVFALIMNLRTYPHLTDERKKRLRYLMAVKAGTAGTYSVLLLIIVPRASVDPSPWSWAYASFLVVAAFGFIGLAGDAADQYATHEVEKGELDGNP